MERSAALVVACMAMVSCGVNSKLTPTHSQVRVIEHTELVPVTVTARLPEIKAEVQRKDSLLRLENRYAWAEARLYRDGSLGLRLETIPQDIRVDTAVVQTTRDSIVTQTIVTDNPVPTPLSWWERLRIRAFWPMLMILLIALRKPIIKAITALWRLLTIRP